MSLPTLAPPRRSAGSSSPQPVAPRAARQWARPPHHEASRKVWRWAIGLSVFVHLLVLAISPLFLRVGLPPGDADAVADSEPARGLQMVDLAARPESPSVSVPVQAAAADAAADFPRTDRAQPRDLRPESVAPRAGEPAPPTTGTDARGNPLQPGIRDSRLWITPREVPKHEPTQEELHAEYMKGLEARIRTYNDSIAGEADRARRATDWTVRDNNGGRWGVSPEDIHLGGVTLPPMTFPPGGGDPDKRARAEEQERTRGEIDRQQADTERRRVREERIQATRERRDQERNQ
jgi:hypothetical protein